MRRIILVVLLLSSLANSLPRTAAAHAQSRPRRVGQASPPSNAPAASTTPPSSMPQSLPRVPQTSAPPPAATARQPSASQPSVSSRPAPSGSTGSTQEPEEVGEDDVVRVNTTLVTVPVSVMDRNGKYVPNMRQADFHLYEQGVEQQIAYFTSTETPFTVALLIDTSRSTSFKIDEIQDAAIAFVNQLRADDRVMVISFDEDIRVLSEATNNRSQLHAAIRRARIGGGTRLYDAVDVVINKEFKRIKGRKAIVLFTDGVDTTSRRATYQSNVRDAEESEALIYPVQYDTYGDVRTNNGNWPFPGGRGPVITLPFPFPFPGGNRRRTRPWPWPFATNAPATNRQSSSSSNALSMMMNATQIGQSGQSSEEYRRASAYLRELAERTGARLHHARNLGNLEASFALIAEELRRQYSIGYYPKNTAQAGERRQIKVRVNQPNLVVRARDSYVFNPSSGSVAQQGQTTRPTPKFDGVTR